eukprot:1824863-Prymnesium_polylepis.2
MAVVSFCGAGRPEGHVVHDVDIVANLASFTKGDACRMVDRHTAPKLAARMNVNTEYVTRL